MWRSFGIGLLLLLQTACGFQLRGASQVAAEYQPIYALGAEDSSSPMQDYLLSEFKRKALAFSDTAATAASQLQLQLGELQEITLASGSEGVTIVSLQRTMHVSWYEPSGAVLFQGEIEANRDLELDSNQVIASDQEKQQADQELIKDLLRVLMHRLQSRRS